MNKLKKANRGLLCTAAVMLLIIAYIIISLVYQGIQTPVLTDKFDKILSKVEESLELPKEYQKNPQKMTLDEAKAHIADVWGNDRDLLKDDSYLETLAQRLYDNAQAGFFYDNISKTVGLDYFSDAHTVSFENGKSVVTAGVSTSFKNKLGVELNATGSDTVVFEIVGGDWKAVDFSILEPAEGGNYSINPESVIYK